MERKKASDFPQELLDLLDGYVHGGISRREFLDGAQKFAVGGITAASLFQMLKPNYAWALQVPADDKRINAGTATVPSPLGNGSIKGYLVRPANASKLPSILVIHENRGLNPYIEDVARRLAVANFIAFAPDGLTSLGGYPEDDEKGLALFGQLDRAKVGEDFVAAANWLKSQPTGGQPSMPPRRRPMYRTKATSTKAPITASITTRPPDTTKPRPRRPGSAR
jgi:carboxymethylenebutenolidase